MSQMNQSPRFFPFHPKEVAAFKAGCEQERNELRDQLLARLGRRRPELAAALRDEPDVQVILDALEGAAAH